MAEFLKTLAALTVAAAAVIGTLQGLGVIDVREVPDKIDEAVGDGSDDSGPTDTDEPAETDEPPPTDTNGSVGDPDASGNLVASASNVGCSYIPMGSLTGADQLTILFGLMSDGEPDAPELVAVDATSDTGLSTSLSSGHGTGDAATAVQLDLRSSDFGLSHTVTIEVDPSNEVPETDETDNSIRVGVDLPSPRPETSIADLSCSTS